MSEQNITGVDYSEMPYLCGMSRHIVYIGFEYKPTEQQFQDAAAKWKEHLKHFWGKRDRVTYLPHNRPHHGVEIVSL